MEGVSYRIPRKPTHIIPIGDIQWAGKDHYSVSLKTLRAMIQKGVDYEKQGHNVFYLGMGDYIDYLSPSNRARLDAATLYDNALDILDKTALYLNDELVELALRPTIGRWLGLVEGHHFKNLQTGATSDMELCKTLKARFLGTSAIIRLEFVRQKNGRYSDRHSVPFMLWVHHGIGNGQTGYYPLMRLEKVAAEWERISAFMIGHTCKQGVELKNKVSPGFATGKFKITHRKVVLIGTGGYSKSYVEGSKQGRIPRGHYSEQGMLVPGVLGSPILHIIPHSIGNLEWFDYTVEA